MTFILRPYELYWSHQDHMRLPTMRGADGKCVQPYTDYYDSLAKLYAKATKQAARSGIDAIAYALLAFAFFLNEEGKSLEEVDDELLEAFLEWELKRVKNNRKSRDDERLARETVNTKGRCIYNFFNWCRKNYYLDDRSIGPSDCRIQSTLPSIDLERNPSAYILAGKRKYPRLLSLTGQNTEVGMGQHWATTGEVDQLEEFFWARGESQIGYRNSMMLRLVELQGWRIGSANSLLCSQFSDKVMEKNADAKFLPVRPPLQKFSATRAFDMPMHFVDRLREYINDKDIGRAAIVAAAEARGITVDSDNVFISLRGSPMAESSWSSIFGDAFKSLGAPKGAAVHAVRRGSAEQRADQLVDGYAEAGMPATQEAVVAELKEFLGHSTAAAQAAYLRVNRRRYSQTQVDRLAKALEERTSERDQHRAAVARLTTKLDDAEKEKLELQAALRAAQRALKRAAKGATSREKELLAA